MHQCTHFTHSPNQVWSEGPLHLTMRHHCFTVNKRALSISKKQKHTHSLAQWDVSNPPSQRNTHRRVFATIKVKLDAFYKRLFKQCTSTCLQMVFYLLLCPVSPFIQLLASISIYRCYCEAGLRWVELCLCVYSQKFPSDAVCKSVTFRVSD